MKIVHSIYDFYLFTQDIIYMKIHPDHVYDHIDEEGVIHMHTHPNFSSILRQYRLEWDVFSE